MAAAAGIAAAACTPIAWPLLVGGAVPAALNALFNQVGTLGGGLLGETVIRVWDRMQDQKLQEDTQAPVTQTDFQDALADELKEALNSSSANAAGLRAELAGVLHRVDAVQVALTTTIESTVHESGDQVRAALIEGLQDLGTRFSEFGWMLDEVSDQLTRIAESQAELAAGSRAMLEAQQLTLMRLTLLLQRSRAPGRDGDPDAVQELASGSDDEERAARLDADRVPLSPDCPYPGLASFGPQDATRFFGRDQLTAVLLTRLAEQLTSAGLLMVLGPSGSGKSSLLRAGLLPTIAQGMLPIRESGSWPLDLMTPGRRPLLELATHVAALAGIPAGGLHADLEADPARIAAAIRQALLAQGRRLSADAGHVPEIASSRLVLVVDQFEEVFTHCTDEQERRAFVQALSHAVQDAPALVIVGLRADFYARSAAYPDLVPYLQDRQVLVGPMDEAGLRAAIEGPAASAGLIVDAGLVEVLLADLGAHPGPAGDSYEAGRLPLLAYALQQTWQHREGRRLTVAAYRATGGIDQAVARAADAVYGGLDREGHQVARRLLLRLVNLGEGTAATRRRATVAELTEGTSQLVARKVLTELIQARLLTTDTDADGTDTVEISHEALISAWPKLHEWLSRDRTGQRVHRDLIDAAHAWQTQDRDPSLLFGGTRLTVAREWAAGHHEELNPGENAFLTASQRRQQRATRLRRFAVAGLAVLTAVALGTAGYAFQQKHTAQGERDQAVVNEVTTYVGQLQNTDPSLAARLDLVARHLQPAVNNTTEILGTANTALSDRLAGPTAPVTALAFSPNGRTLAAVSDDGNIRLWNVTSPGHPVSSGQALNTHARTLTSIAFSPDGDTLAVGAGNGTVLLWNVTDPARPALLGKPLTGPKRYVSSVAFSPDGKTLAAGSYDYTVWLWNVTDPARPTSLGLPLSGSNGSILSVAFSPDGKTLAAGSYGDDVWLWNVTDPAHATRLAQPIKGSYPVWAVAFSPNGSDLAVSSGDSFWIWNVANPAHPKSMGLPLTGGADNTVLSLAFNPDGTILAAGSGDDKIRLWNITSVPFVAATPIGAPLRGHGGPVYSVAFNPDGYTLASGSGDDTVRLWNLPLTVLPGQTSAVGTVAFTPDGRTMATGSNDDTVRLWDVANPAYPTPLGQPLIRSTSSIEALAFSPNGQNLAAASNNTIRLWDVALPFFPLLLGHPLTASAGTVRSVAFSPKGHILAAASNDSILLWDVSDPAHPTALGLPLTGFPNLVRSVAFSPDGHTLAAGGDDDTIRLWDVSNPARPTPVGPVLYGHTNYVNSVAFSPDGKLLASSSSDDTVRLWDVAEPAHARAIGQPLTGPTDSIFGVAFSPDGRTLAAGSGDDTIWLWNTSDPAHATAVGQPITEASAVDSVAFQPGGDVLATGTGDGTTQLWNLNVGQAIDRICATTGNDLAPQQWTTYVSQLPYTPPCSAQPPPSSLPASAEASVFPGTWNGTYFCAQGETGIRLAIQAGSDHTLTATFNAYPLPSNPTVPRSTFTMTGFYSGRGIVLIPAYWINKPPGYFMVGLTGDLTATSPRAITGEVAAPAGCTTFSVRKL